MKTGNLINILIISLLILSSILPANAQDEIKWYARSSAVASSHDIVPMWIHTSKFGTINNFGNGELSLLAGTTYKTEILKNIDLTIGLEGFVSNEFKNHSALSQLYGEFNWGPASLIIGKRNIDFLNAKTQQVPFMDFRNIRPFPYLSFGFYDYTNIPFTKGYLQFKASYLQGYLNDDRDPIGVEEPLYHFKSLYGKTGNFPIQLFIGMNHAVMFGGTMQNGTKIPVDFYNTYLINASEKVGKVLPGEGMNKPGEHLGFVDMGAILEIKDFYFDFTFQNIFTDYSGFIISDDDNLIFNFYRKGKHLISRINYEYGYSKHQSGSGLENRYYDSINDFTQYLRDNFEYTGEPIETPEEFKQIIYSYTGDYNEQYSGRDNYFNNGIYPLGHFYDDHFFGTATMHSNKQLKLFKEFNGPYFENIGNNRIVSHHISVSGWINSELNYEFKNTYTQNFGTYSGYYLHDFIEREDYYFKDGKSQNYFSLELNYQKEYSPLSYFLTIGIDTGELYDSYGIMCGISYSGIISSKTSKSKKHATKKKSYSGIWAPKM